MLFQRFRPEVHQRPVRDDRFPKSYATLSTLCHFTKMQPARDGSTGLTHRTTQLSRALLKGSRSAADKNDRYSFLKRGPRCGNTCDTPMATRYTRARAGRSTDDRCQDRPASETIFEFGPGGTRIAMLRVAYNERASKQHRAYERVRTHVARLFSRSVSWFSAHDQSICQIYRRQKVHFKFKIRNHCVLEVRELIKNSESASRLH